MMNGSKGLLDFAFCRYQWFKKIKKSNIPDHGWGQNCGGTVPMLTEMKKQLRKSKGKATMATMVELACMIRQEGVQFVWMIFYTEWKLPELMVANTPII